MSVVIMPLIYRGFDVIERPGIGLAIVVKAEMRPEELRTLLQGDYDVLFILDRYSVTLCPAESIEARECSGDLKAFEIRDLRGYAGFSRTSSGLSLEFEIPVSAELIDYISEIRRRKKVVVLIITYALGVTKLGYGGFLYETGHLEKMLPSGERSYIMTFSTEEVDDLMKKLGYAEFVRFEVPIPTIPEVPIEVISKCASELKSAEEALTKGDYLKTLNVVRNVIMNYLTDLIETEKERRRVLRRELRERILSNIPERLKDIYKEILDGIEATLISNLRHVHKFIHEETGKLIATPMREDAEYVYTALLATLRYLSQLVVIWGRKEG
jgi:hypothetical protein